MKVAEYIVKRLLDKGVKDAFGIPGGVILRLMYTMQEQEDFSIHLNYHEQMAGFAACGYAWATNGFRGYQICSPVLQKHIKSHYLLYFLRHMVLENTKICAPRIYKN